MLNKKAEPLQGDAEKIDESCEQVVRVHVSEYEKLLLIRCAKGNPAEAY